MHQKPTSDWGSAPDQAGEAYCTLPDPLAGFYFKRRGREEIGGERERKGMGGRRVLWSTQKSLK